MKHIMDFVGSELVMSQPSAFKQQFEFAGEGGLVATLKFNNSFSTLATAESADGCWNFKRIGFWQNKTIIKECGSELELGVFQRNAWKGGGALELHYGRRYILTTNFWQTQGDFKFETEEIFIHYKIGGFFRVSVPIRIETNARSIRELPWIVLLGAYTIIMMRRDSAAAS